MQRSGVLSIQILGVLQMLLLLLLVMPIVPAAVAVIYRQLRIHREGMDLVLLQQHIGG